MEFQGKIEDGLLIWASGESIKPTIVLVHGAFEDGSIWYRVIQRLQRDGYPVVVFANPLLGVAFDAAYLRSLVDRIEGPLILVAHSYGGTVITQAGADDPKVGASSTPQQLCPRQGKLQAICSNRSLAARSPRPSRRSPTHCPMGPTARNSFTKPTNSTVTSPPMCPRATPH
ncbi:esterase/lipase family protein [Edaphobacter sp. HDX4]|uniref:esterase/lipase family protein n=1 Tax=Edaphobacter sp. HDX4 TaxID=2794064 RepID=UPI002FE607A7